jgi:hypothetical protein
MLAEKFYDVKICKNRSCLTVWNRDVNAARSIRALFLYMNENEGQRFAPWKREAEVTEVESAQSASTPSPGRAEVEMDATWPDQMVSNGMAGSQDRI